MSITWSLPHASQRADIRALVRSHSSPPSHLQLEAIARSQLVELSRYKDHRRGLEAICSGSAAYRRALQAYYHDCEGFRAPIRRLPAEILVHIFSLCSASAADAHTFDSTLEYRTELARLANVPLLTLSRVCARWHSIVMNTPTLWSRLQLNDVLWATHSRWKNTIALLTAALERSRNALISVSISGDRGRPRLAQVFTLLAQHSHRWEVATFSCSFSGLDLAHLNGNLPCLKRIEINSPRRAPRALDFLVGAPHLIALTASVQLLEQFGAIIPFKQLRKLVCLTTVPPQIARGISVAPQLPTGSHFQLEFRVDRRVYTLRIPPTTAFISVLSLLLTHQFQRAHAAHALGGIFACLTLPCLQQLEVSCSEYPQLRMDWPHARFLALCARSGFQRCLKTLLINHVAITARELVDVLSALGSLESLSIADQRQQGERDGVALVNNALLRALTFSATAPLAAPNAAEPALLPRLRHMSCSTFLYFSAAALARFLESRLDHWQRAPADSEPSFNVEICADADGLPGQLNGALVRRMLRELSARNERFLYTDAGYGYVCAAAEAGPIGRRNLRPDSLPPEAYAKSAGMIADDKCKLVREVRILELRSNGFNGQCTQKGMQKVNCGICQHLRIVPVLQCNWSAAPDIAATRAHAARIALSSGSGSGTSLLTSGLGMNVWVSETRKILLMSVTDELAVGCHYRNREVDAQPPSRTGPAWCFCCALLVSGCSLTLACQ
ncbi:hypothetical protein GGX14DRAFT_627507 [Mycena pura]|uniref:F-box domain-containing protein n=1 Tax=Mycena pura TaxID=153505 RepID=A0AAD7E3Q8_9AGAR|nr:hypothetical protein GGX14DRAFT_627507 [Mycena pura]